jgi:hypothetical protein
MLTNDRRYTPNKTIDFMFEIFKRLKNTINNKQFEFMLRNNSFNKPGLLTAKFAYPSAFNCNHSMTTSKPEPKG